MAPNMALQRTRSPSSGRRSRRISLPAILQHIQAHNTSNTSINDSINNMSPFINLTDLSDALDIPASSSKHKESIKARGVRFNSKISVVEIPAPEQTQAHRVSFSDEIIDIDTAELSSSSQTSSPPRKRVRFGCMKNSVRKHFSHTPIYKMKNFDAISPLMTSKKRVRFGCMKGEPPTVTHTSEEVSELLADEAATFKREKRRGSTSTYDSEMSEQINDSEELEVD